MAGEPGVGFSALVGHQRVDDGRAIVGQGKQERCERGFEGKADGLRINYCDHHVFRECTRRPLLEGHQAIEGKLDGVGVDFGAVIELVAGFELELPDQVVRRHSPAFGQVTLDFGAAFFAVGLVAHQSLVRRVGDGPVVVVEGHGRVQGLRVGRLADNQRVLGGGRGCGLPGP